MRANKLISLIKNEDLHGIKELLGKGCPPRKTGFYLIRSNSPLVLSVEMKYEKIYKILLKYGADVNETNNQRETSLQVACYNDDLLAVKTLLQYKADVDFTKKYNPRPILIACTNNSIELINTLLNHNADVEYIWQECSWSRFSRPVLEILVKHNRELVPLRLLHLLDNNIELGF